jgi:hypothetical protein
MNPQLPPRTDLMLPRGYPACAWSASHCCWLFSSACSTNLRKLLRRCQVRVTAPSTHHNPPPTDRQNHPNPIQLP